MRGHSLTLSSTPKSMRCDSWAFSWPAPLQAFALVTSPRLGLQQLQCSEISRTSRCNILEHSILEIGQTKHVLNLCINNVSHNVVRPMKNGKINFFSYRFEAWIKFQNWIIIFLWLLELHHFFHLMILNQNLVVEAWVFIVDEGMTHVAMFRLNKTPTIF